MSPDSALSPALALAAWHQAEPRVRDGGYRESVGFAMSWTKHSPLLGL